MRLGQLARKLALRPSQIVDYLASKEIFPEEGSNAKLTDEMTERILLHFAPERLKEVMTVEENNEERIPEAVEENLIQSEEKMEVESVDEQPLTEATLAQGTPEIIKAPKVELSGLKVLGKIELPEAKKKSEPVSDATVDVPETNEPIPRKEKKRGNTEGKDYSQRRESFRQRSVGNPIAEERERKARDEEERRKAKLERDKEKKTQYYLRRVKLGQPTKAVKIVSEPLESFAHQEVRPAPKTLWGKFMRWLNT